MNFEYGEEITVRAAGNRTLTRIVAKDAGDVVLIAQAGELEMAAKENREPNTVAFKKTDVIQGGARKPPMSHRESTRSVSKAGD